ncbi:enoyl-ACP reductase-like protein [Paenibacillus sp. BK033]|uniref:SDR family oxidoreductase n=1 Tax=Paenibacillus sp. BK033 TaxID=2512133 RepID=UPI0010F0DE50|nr:SDR family oxidoreductase [Paenibacillus sp. BK033]TCM89144.1 enoyl-ACP reductase-like protein [Paenibacillus sp. BK033]
MSSFFRSPRMRYRQFDLNQGIADGNGTHNSVVEKAALRAMTKDAAMEFAIHGVRVNSIHPGYINTAMLEWAPRWFSMEAQWLDKQLFILI